MSVKAYLVVLCNIETNAIESVDIWSSPEWEQSICLPCAVYLSYITQQYDSFELARKSIVRQLHEPRWRYHRLLKYFSERVRGQMLEDL